MPRRVEVRPPFINYSLIQKMTGGGHLLSDIVAYIGSINVVAAELDQ